MVRFLLILQKECPSNCSPNRAGSPRKHVCGNDGKTYPSACHLRRQQCQSPNSNLKLHYRGKCRPSKEAGQQGALKNVHIIVYGIKNFSEFLIQVHLMAPALRVRRRANSMFPKSLRASLCQNATRTETSWPCSASRCIAGASSPTPATPSSTLTLSTTNLIAAKVLVFYCALLCNEKS